jgi:hypothetical protein
VCDVCMFWIQRWQLLNWFLARSENCEKATVSFVMSVCPSVIMEQIGSHWTDFVKFSVWIFFENLSRKFEFR